MKSKLRRFLSLVLVCSMVLPLCAFAPIAYAADTESEDTVIIDVTNFGADKTGAKDSAPAIVKAVAEAKKYSDAGKAVTISFPKGRYDFYPEYAFSSDLYISNTNSSYIEEFVTKKIAILIEDMKNVTVDGGNSLFMLHGRMGGFFSINSENVTFKNFTLDMQVPTIIDVTIEKYDGANSVIAYIPECYIYDVQEEEKDIIFYGDNSPYTGKPYWTLKNSTFVARTQSRDLETGVTKRIMEKLLLTNATSVEELENNRIKITYASAEDVYEPGTVIEMRRNDRDVPGAYFWDSKNVVAQNIDIGFMHGFGICAQTTENITIDDIRFKTLPGKGTFSTCTADQIHPVSCYGDIIIKNCYFENPHDDPINVHGHHMLVTEISADRTQVRIKAMHNQNHGIPNFHIGDEIEFLYWDDITVLENSKRTIVSIDGPNGRKGGKLGNGTDSLAETVLTLSEPIPEDVTVEEFLVENITATPNVYIYNNEFVAVPTRGILCTTKGEVVIENNIFDFTNNYSIYISDDGNGWYESGRCEDVTIRNNIFRNSHATEIAFDPVVKTIPSKDNAIHRNILIEGNTFFKTNNTRVLNATSVDNITIRNNKIYRENPNVVIKATVAQNAMSVGSAQQLSVSATGTTLSTNVWKLVNSANIVFENNQYDGGINASIGLTGADSSDVTIKNDIVKIDASNVVPVAGDKYYYKSSNEAVVKVSPDGVLTAVGKGTAEITVYSVVAERKYESTPVIITVSDDITAFPTKIEITTARENIDVGETVKFDALVQGNGNKTVTWSVYDPETLGKTSVATITSDGRLTALAGGVVGIRAKTSNGLEARKIVTIQTEWQFTDSFAIVNEIAGGYHILGENELMIAGNNGGIWNAQLPANLIVGTFEETKGQTIVATVKVTGKTHYKHDQAGIVFYKDNDNYTALHLKHGENDPTITVGNEINWTDRNNYSIKLSEIPGYNGEIYMKLEKTGDTVSGYYSLNGNDWVLIQTVTNPNLGTDYKVALEADVNATHTPPTEYTFTEFKINGKSVPLAQKATFGTIQRIPEITYENNTLSVNTNGLFSDNDTYAIVKWAMSDTVDGVYTLIDEEASAVIGASSQMNGKYVKAAIIPARNATTVGDIVWTNAIYVTGATDEKPEGTKADALLGSATFTGLSNPFATFSSSTIGYYTTATVDETSVGYSFAALDSDATVEVTLNGVVVPASGTALLINSHNKFIVKVTAAGGVTVKTYSFIIRQGDVVPDLPTITVDAGNNPSSFNPYRATGSTTVQDRVTAYQVTPTNDSKETVQLDNYKIANFGSVTFPDYKYVGVTYYLDDNGSGNISEVMMQLDQLKSSNGSLLMNRVTGYQQTATAVTGKWVTQYFDFTEYAAATGSNAATAGLSLAQCRFYPFGTLAANTITGGEVSYVQGYSFLAGAPKLYNADGTRSMINDGTQTVYVAARGYVIVSGVRYEAYTTLEAAMNAIGPVGGTICISGTIAFEDVDTPRGAITIQGCDSSAKLSNEYLIVKSGDLTVRNIAIKGASEKYSQAANGYTITIGEGVTVDSGNYLRFGVTKENPDDPNATGQTVNVYSGTYKDFGVVNQWSGGKTVTGDTVFNFYGGTFTDLRGIAKDGNANTTNPSVVNGDVYYNLYGGSYSGSYITSYCTVTLNGNLWYTVNGGSFASNTVGFAFGTVGTPSKSTVTLNGSEIILINNKEIKENGGTLSGVAIGKAINAGTNASKFKVSGYKFVIINNYELSPVTGAEISAGAVGDYQLLVCGGTATPVFDENNNLVGFVLTPDDKDGVPYLNGEKMVAGENGLYVIPASTGVTRTITFKSSDKQVNVTFTDGTNKTQSTVNAKSTVLAPAWSYEKPGYAFAGWKVEGDDTLYLPTDVIKVGEGDLVITAVYVAQKDIETVYVKQSALFEGTGLDERSPVKSIQAAIAKVGGTTSDYRIVILDDYYLADKAAALVDNVVHTGTITFSTSEGASLGWGHSFYTGGPAIFENIRINATQSNQFINVEIGKLVFGENVEILNYAPKIHAGIQNKDTPYQEVELNSGSVYYLYAGSYYNNSTTTPLQSNGTKVTINDATVTVVYLGPDGYSGNNGPTEWISSPSLVMNGGTITNEIAAGSSGAETVFTAPAQIVFNNGTSAKISDSIPTDRRIVVRSTSDGYVDVTATTGVFKITTDKKNIYIDGEWVEKTPDNLYTLGIGDHTVTYDDQEINLGSIVSGTVTSSGSETAAITIALIPEGTTEAAYTTTVQGNLASYSISGVKAGAYTLKVTKANHLVAEEKVTISDVDVTKDFSLVLGNNGKQFKINSAYLVLSQDINVIYRTTLPNGFTNPRMVFEFNGETIIVTEYTVDNQGRYCYSFPKVNPQKMGDNICATLYATVDGVEVSVSVPNYSVRQYCVNQLSKNPDANLKRMISDLLVYGEKTQLYQNYKTDALVTEGLDLTPSTFETLDASYNKLQLIGTADPNVKYSSASLELSNDMIVLLGITTNDPTPYTFEVTANGETNVYTSQDLTYRNGKYYLSINGVKATKFNDVITAVIKKDGVQIGHTLNYSVNTYVQKNQNTGNTVLGDLLKAIYNYGESAKLYEQ